MSLSETTARPAPAGAGRLAGPALAIAAVAGLGAVAAFGGEQTLSLATQTLIFILFCVSLNLLVGYAGLVSVGHAAVYATGGYVAGYLARTGTAGFAASVAAGVAAAALIAALMAAISVRREKTYFIMLTLAVAQLVSITIAKWKSVTGGDDGLIGFAPPPVLQDSRVYFVFTVIAVALSLTAIHRIVSSPYGRTLKAVRDNPRRAAFAGLNVAGLQVSAFAIAGAFAGLAGALTAFYQRGMFVQSSGFLASTDALVACVLGGPRYFLGPVAGAILFRALTGLVPALTPYWGSVLGLVILLVGRFMPGGLLSLAARLRGRP